MKNILFCYLLVCVFIMTPSLSYADQIHEAAKSGDVKTVKALIEKDPGLMYVKDEQGKTALHWATGRGQPKVIQLLIDHKVDINVRNSNGGTAAHVAASQAQPQALRLLIKNGIDIHATTKDGATALHFAAFKSKEGHYECAKILIDNGINVNAAMKNGVTALQLAISRNNTKVAELLRKNGATEPQQTSMRRRRPMMRDDWSD